MTKDEMIKELNDKNIDTSNLNNYKAVLKMYKEIFTTIPNDIIEEPIIDVVLESSNEKKYSDDSIKNNLIKDIILLMDELKGRTKGTPEEIKTMFLLYNNFYKRADSPNCAMCVSNVYSKLFNIYKKYR